MRKYNRELNKLKTQGEILGANIFFTNIFYLSSTVKIQRQKNTKPIYKTMYIDALNSYVHSKKAIIIDSDMSAEAKLYTLIHEIGHYIQDMENGFQRSRKHISKEMKQICVFQAFDQKNTKDSYIEHERQAWDYGEDFAKYLKIKLSPNFYKFREYHIKSYESLSVKK